MLRALPLRARCAARRRDGVVRHRRRRRRPALRLLRRVPAAGPRPRGAGASAGCRDPQLQPDVPLKILTNFVAEQEWLLEPGDMLYLPPRWAHDGIAEGECMTCSIGFRAPGARRTRARAAAARARRRRDADGATALPRPGAAGRPTAPGAFPQALQRLRPRRAGAPGWREPGGFDLRARRGAQRAQAQRLVRRRRAAAARHARVRLDRRTRMLYDERHVFINGESFRAGGRDATLMRRLADRRALDARARSLR